MRKRKNRRTPNWLLLMHQLPPKPDAFRVKVWRKLQRAGAVSLKNSVYVLPDTKIARRSLEAIAEEIKSSGADAFLCDARFLQGVDTNALVRQFNGERDERYHTIAKDAERLLVLLKGKAATSAGKLMRVAHELGKLRRQLDETAGIDFFSAAGRTRAERLVSELESRAKLVRSKKPANALEGKSLREYQRRTWVTRRNLYVDRLASAWLIRRFIDPSAKFRFIDLDRERLEKNEILFDAVGGEFTHHGDLCTFEVLIRSFGLPNRALVPIAEIIHDIDLNDSKYQREETVGIEVVIRGIAKSEKDDFRRIERASGLLDELYATFGRGKT